MKTSPVRLTAIIAALATALPALPGLGMGMDISYSVFKTPPEVVAVQSCGSWRGDNPNEFYRLVHAEKYGGSMLYIQWMRRDALGNGAITVVHTLTLPELNNDHIDISLEQLRCRATRNGITISAKAASAHDATLKRIIMDVDHALGRYRLRQLKTP